MAVQFLGSVGQQSQFTADCANCFGLCCTALAFARSADFAFDKPAGDPCTNLAEDYLCTIHPKLRESGFKGCTVFDCFGAGQKVSQHTFGGTSWRDDAGTRTAMFAVFPVVRQLQELLYYLDEALRAPATAPIRSELEEAFLTLAKVTKLPAEQMADVDIDQQREEVAAFLGRASELIRASAQAKPLPKNLRRRITPGADLIGAKLKGTDLRGANLRGAYLIAADLRGADLRGTDVIGADMRDTDLRGANLTEALFLTQLQLNAAHGDITTRLPDTLTYPSHWPQP